MAPATSDELATAACVVIAPMVTVPPDTVMPASSLTPPRSMRSEGCARRCLSVGISVIPPATNLPSSAPFRALTASATDDGLR